MQGVAGFDVRVFRSEADTSHYFTSQIIATAKRLDYFANLTADRWWVRLRIRHAAVASLVVSFHHLGRGDQGLMVASAFLDQRELSRGRGGDDDGAPFDTRPICDDTFAFTDAMDEARLESAFREWLDRTIQVGLDAWRRGL